MFFIRSELFNKLNITYILDLIGEEESDYYTI